VPIVGPVNVQAPSVTPLIIQTVCIRFCSRSNI